MSAVRSQKWQLALGVISLGACFMFASSALASAPGGVACRPADGKISARGSTFAKQLWDTMIVSYRDDFCGRVEDSAGLHNGYLVDPAGGTNPTTASAMIGYNYPNSQTGSGEGRTAMQCRTDAFGRSDAPYNNAQYAALSGAPLAAASCPPVLGGSVSPFLAGPFGGVGATVPMMSFPVGVHRS